MLQVDTLLVPAERLSYGCFRMRDGRDVLGALFSAHELQRTSSSPTIELQCCKSRTWCGRKSSGGCHTTVRFPFLKTERGRVISTSPGSGSCAPMTTTSAGLPTAKP